MFKRLLFKSVVMLVIFIGGGSYMAYTMGYDVGRLGSITGKLFQSARLGNLDLETMRIDSATVEDNTRVLQAGEHRVYKWQDQSGQWHYTQIRPPAHARAVESIDLNPEQNVIAGFRAPEADEEPIPEPLPEPIVKAEPEPQFGIEGLSDNPYSPESIKKLFDDAQNLQQTLGQRYEIQQQLMNGTR